MSDNPNSASIAYGSRTDPMVILRHCNQVEHFGGAQAAILPAEKLGLCGQLCAESCASPLVDLTSVDHVVSLGQIFDRIKQVYVRQAKRIAMVGAVLLVRSLAPAYRDLENDPCALNLLVEDTEGYHVAFFRLVNFGVNIPGSGFPLSPVKVPIGSLIAIMHPVIRPIPSDPTCLRLEVENPMHFQILGREHFLVKSGHFDFIHPLPFASEVDDFAGVDDLNKIGVQYFIDKNFYMALDCFNQFIDEGKGDLRLAYSNRAAAYLAVGRQDKALEDAGKGLEMDPDRQVPKLLLRKAKALFQLGRFEDCRAFLETNRVEEGSLPDYEMIAKKVLVALEEVKGHYDLKAMRQEVLANAGRPYLEWHADFFNTELLEVKDDEILAKSMIEPGTLLMANRALAFHLEDKTKPEKFDDEARIAASGLSKAYLIFFAKISLNITGVMEKVPRRLHHLLGDVEELTNMTINVPSSYSKSTGCGIWPSPVLTIGHSCVDPNCVTSFCGDFCFVRARRTIKTGEALTLNDFTPTKMPYELRMLSFEQRGIRPCECRYCLMERSEPQETREIVTKAFEVFFNATKSLYPYQKDEEKGITHPDNAEILATVKLLEESLQQLESVRSSEEQKLLNFSAHYMRITLASYQRLLGNFQLGAELSEQSALSCEKLGLLTDGHRMARAFKRAGNIEREQYWLERDRQLHKLLYDLEKDCDDETEDD